MYLNPMEKLGKQESIETPFYENEKPIPIEDDNQMLYINEASEAENLFNIVKKEEINQLPFKIIGHLHASFTTKNTQKLARVTNGTAFLIHQNIALTAAHNVELEKQLDFQISKEHSRFFLGKFDGDSHAIYKIDRIKIPEDYKRGMELTKESERLTVCAESDFALLFLKRLDASEIKPKSKIQSSMKVSSLKEVKEYVNINEFMRFVSISSFPKEEYQLLINGYPFEVNKNMNCKLKKQEVEGTALVVTNPYYTKKQIWSINSKYIHYQNPTQKGSSGGPIIIELIRNQGTPKQSKEYRIIGIHKATDLKKKTLDNKCLNFGLNSLLFKDQVNQWLRNENKIPLILTEREHKYVDQIVKRETTWLDLKDLDLSTQQLQNIFSYDLNHITWITLCGNNITNQGFKCLTAKQMPHLVTLHLSENNISSLDGWKPINLKSLTSLCLSLNELSKLPDDFKLLQNLVKLWLCYNKFQSIPQVLKELKQLKMLWMYDNLFKKETAEKSDIFKKLQNNDVNVMLEDENNGDNADQLLDLDGEFDDEEEQF